MDFLICLHLAVNVGDRAFFVDLDRDSWSRTKTLRWTPSRKMQSVKGMGRHPRNRRTCGGSHDCNEDGGLVNGRGRCGPSRGRIVGPSLVADLSRRQLAYETRPS